MSRAEKSTNDRSASIPTSLRGALGFLARLSPSLAARAAARLFLLVPRLPKPRGEAAAFLASGDAFRVNVDGRSLAAWSYGSGPAVLLVHGWAGRGAQMRAFVPALVAAGYRAVVFDAPGHGASPGRSASLPAFASAITAVARATGARAVIAHSMGGAATLLAISRGLRLSFAVTIGSPSSATRIWDGWRRALGLSVPVADAARRILEARVGTSFSSLDVVAVGPRVDVPVLVLHDEDDEEIAVTDGDDLLCCVRNARLVRTRGLGHRRILRDPDVARRAVAFLAEEKRAAA